MHVSPAWNTRFAGVECRFHIVERSFRTGGCQRGERPDAGLLDVRRAVSRTGGTSRSDRAEINLPRRRARGKRYEDMAQYAMQEVAYLHDTEQTIAYPRMLISGISEGKHLAELVARNCTFNPAEVAGIIRRLAEVMAQEMAAGRSVRLEGIGLFTPGLALAGSGRPESAEDAARRNARSVRVSTVRYRADKGLVRATAALCRLERSRRKCARRVSPYTPEQRLALAQAHLREHPTLTLADYAALAGISRTSACRELRRWSATPGSGIGIRGYGSHRIYVADPSV